MPGKKDKLDTRKGTEDKSVVHDMDRDQEKSYPRPTEEDRQFDNQPEFTEKDSSRKDEEEV